MCSVLCKGLSLNANLKRQISNQKRKKSAWAGPRLSFLLFIFFWLFVAFLPPLSCFHSSLIQGNVALRYLIWSWAQTGKRLQSQLVQLTSTKCNQDNQVSFCKLLRNSPRACTDSQSFQGSFTWSSALPSTLPGSLYLDEKQLLAIKPWDVVTAFLACQKKMYLKYS